MLKSREGSVTTMSILISTTNTNGSAKEDILGQPHGTWSNGIRFGVSNVAR